jgi:hypothetical protein
MRTFAQQQSYVFNAILLDFLKELRDEEGMKPLLKGNYKDFKKKSDEYIVFFRKQVTDEIIERLKQPASAGSLLDNPAIREMLVFIDVRVCDVLDIVVGDNSQDTNTVELYMYLLLAIVHFDRCHTMDDTARALLLSKTLRVLKGDDETIDDVLDDTVHAIFVRVRELRTRKPSMESMMPNLEGTQIGALTKEIADSFDMNSLASMDPKDLLNPEILLGGEGKEGNALGGLINNIRGTIERKLESGELDQDRLRREAEMMMETLKFLPGMPDMKQFAKSELE